MSSLSKDLLEGKDGLLPLISAMAHSTLTRQHAFTAYLLKDGLVR